MKWLLSTFLFISIIATTGQAQEFRKYANNYLYNGVDARGMSMGNAVVVSSSDTFASYWNPSGLTSLDMNRTQIGGMHVFDGLYNFDVISMAFPNRKEHVLSFSAIRYGVDDIPNTIFLVDASGNIDPSNITSFSSADYGGFISYAKKTRNEKISIGGSAKIIHRSVGEFAKAWGAGIDVGVRVKSLNGKFNAAATARDLVGTYTSWNFTLDDPEIIAVFEKTGNEIPSSGSIEATSPSLVLGSAYKIEVGKITIWPEANFDITFDGKRNTLISADPVSIDPHFGLEVGYQNTLFLRGGINNVQEITNIDLEQKEWEMQPSAGGGIKLPGFELDYAVTQYDLRQDITHLITLKLGLSKPGTKSIEDE